MKKTIFLSLFLLFLSGTGGATSNSLYSNLLEVNQEWAHYKDVVPNIPILFATDETRIQTHLKLVIAYLKGNCAPNLTKNQLKNRFELLGALEEYANQKEFPINTKFSYRQPCFVDDYNSHCAVGYMMSVSGNDALVDKIKENYNDDFIRDIKTSGVEEWATFYGFTLEELKWIQPSYPPTETYSSIENGTNGTVNYIRNNYGSPGFVFSGEFTTVNLLPCLNIGVYDGEALSCLGDGIAGIVNGIYRYADTYYVYGELESDGEIFPLAIYEDDSWIFVAHPTLIGASVTAAHINTSVCELAISHPSFEGQEIWFYSSSGEWTKKGALNGIVKVIKPSSLGRIYAGHFTTAQTISDEGVIAEFSGRNVLIRQNFSGEWSMLDEEVSDTIKSIYEIGTSVFFGGSAGTDLESDICLSRYYEGIMQPLIKISIFGSPVYATINAIEFDNDRRLFIGGYFFMEEFMTYGQHFAQYDLVYNSIKPMSQFNQQINALYRKSEELYIGGDFTGDVIHDDYNFLVKLNPPIDLLTNELIVSPQLKIYPNPFTDYIQLEGVTDGADYQLINGAGHLIRQGRITNQTISNLSDLPAGNYFVLIQYVDQVLNFKVVK